MSVFAREEGSDGVPVVLLHGFGGTHAVWAPIQDELARKTATLAYDLPGHGRSFDVPDAGPAKVAAKALLADLAARGVGRAHVAGHSMGGAVAALMAMYDPGRIASLTLVAPGGFGPDINHRLLRRYAAAADEASLTPCLEAMCGWYSPVPPRALSRLIAERALPGRTEKLMAMADAMVKDGRQGQLPQDKLAALSMPVAVAWGGLDNVLPVRQTQGLPWHFALHLFPGLGHMLPDEAPAEIAALILRAAQVEKPHDDA